MSGEASQDPLLLLTPSLSPSNVHVVAKLASKIPCAGGTTLTAGMVFCAFALKQFWKGAGESSKERAEVCKCILIATVEQLCGINCEVMVFVYPRWTGGDVMSPAWSI